MFLLDVLNLVTNLKKFAIATDDLFGIENAEKPSPILQEPEYFAKKFMHDGPPLGTIDVSQQLYFPSIEFRIVQSVGELEQAAHLVYEQYVDSGYIPPNPYERHLSLFNALPSTVTFVAWHVRHGALATITVVEDSALGLPMEKIFGSEVNALRHQGHKVMELSMFAVHKEKLVCGSTAMTSSQRFIFVCHLIRAALDYVRTQTKITHVLECCHPSHDGFYKLLMAKPLGGERSYSNVNGNPAIARYWDLYEGLAADRKDHTAQRLLCGDLPMDLRYANRLKLTADQFERLFKRESNVLASASDIQRNYIETLYSEKELAVA